MKRTPEFFVSVDRNKPGGGWCIFLSGVGEETVPIGPFDNQAVANELSEKVEKYLAALVRAVQAGR